MEFTIYYNYETCKTEYKDKKKDIFENYFFTHMQKENLLKGKTVTKFGIKYKIKFGEVTKVGVVKKNK